MEEMGEECLEKNHPLQNDLILDQIFGYLDTGTKDSYKTLKALREVCRQWKDHVTPRIMNRSKIVTYTTGPQGYLIWETKNQQYLDFLMTQAKTTSLEIIHPHYESLNAILMKNQLWNSPTNWIRSNGNKFTRLTISGEFHENVLTSLLQEWIPNLSELKLCTVRLSKKSNVVEEASSTDLKSPENLKHLTIEFCVDSFFKETNVRVDDAIESAFKVLSQAKNLQSLTLNPETRNFLLCFFNKILSQDKGMLSHLTKLDLMTVYSPGTVPQILAQLELKNLKELHIFIPKTGKLTTLLEVHGQNLEKLFVHVKKWWFDGNEAAYIPRLSKLEQLTCAFDYAYFWGLWNNKHNANKTLIFTAERVISSMPRLKSWKIQDDGSVSQVPCSKTESQCCHLQKLFETSDGLPLSLHTSLEQLDVFCPFKKPHLVQVMADTFVNIQILTIWINSGQINPFFTHLCALKKLKHLIIQIDNSILDYPTAINSNMANFKCLKELTFEKVPMERHRRKIYHVANLHNAHPGFANCETLRIFSFSNLKIDPNELEQLRKELLKSNPKLAVNHHYDEDDDKL